MTILDKVKEGAPSEPKAGEKRSKLETGHLALLKALQDRVEIIDNELAVSFRLHHIAAFVASGRTLWRGSGCVDAFAGKFCDPRD